MKTKLMNLLPEKEAEPVEAVVPAQEQTTTRSDPFVPPLSAQANTPEDIKPVYCIKFPGRFFFHNRVDIEYSAK
jgi:hypothetical protein